MKNVFLLAVVIGTCLFSSSVWATGKPMLAQSSVVINLSQVQSQPLNRKAVKIQQRLERRMHFMQRILGNSGENKVLGAALLALFLGGLGIHRVYLGGSGLLILGYIVTIGGLFGILPLIDFVRIITGGIDHYQGNNALFAAFQGMN